MRSKGRARLRTIWTRLKRSGSSLCLATIWKRMEWHVTTPPASRGTCCNWWLSGRARRSDRGALNGGMRYGWILTDPHLPGFLRGRFEYAVDAIPVFFVFQPGNNAFGVGFDPIGLKWNFERHGKVSPYLELAGGTLFTN